MKLLVFLFLLLPLSAFAQPAWFLETSTPDFKNDKEISFTAAATSAESKELAIANATLSFQTELNKIRSSFYAFVYRDVKAEGFDFNKDNSVSESDFLKKCYPMLLNYSLPSPKCDKVEVTSVNGEYRAYVRFKVNRLELAKSVMNFIIGDLGSGIYTPFRQSYAYQNYFY